MVWYTTTNAGAHQQETRHSPSTKCHHHRANQPLPAERPSSRLSHPIIIDDIHPIPSRIKYAVRISRDRRVEGRARKFQENGEEIRRSAACMIRYDDNLDPVLKPKQKQTGLTTKTTLYCACHTCSTPSRHHTSRSPI